MRWLKVFIVIGTIVMVHMLAFPFLMARVENQEQQRFLDCQQGKRLDCEPSIIWSMQEWTLAPNAATPEPSAPTTAATTTSMNSPVIVSVHSEGMSPWGSLPQHYEVKGGAAITFTVQTANAKTVDVFDAKDRLLLHLKSEGGGSFIGSLKATNAMAGNLTFRATGDKGETADLKINVTIR